MTSGKPLNCSQSLFLHQFLGFEGSDGHHWPSSSSPGEHFLSTYCVLVTMMLPASPLLLERCLAHFPEVLNVCLGT